MKREDKSKAIIRLNDAEEFIQSAKDNLEKGRYKASLDHSVDSTIAANDAFTIFLVEEVASTDHKEAILLSCRNKAIGFSRWINSDHQPGGPLDIATNTRRIYKPNFLFLNMF